MSESMERFKVYKVSGNFGEWEVEDIVDDEVVIDHIIHKYLADKVCDKLNQLSDENEMLKQKMREAYDYFYNYIDELKAEEMDNDGQIFEMWEIIRGLKR